MDHHTFKPLHKRTFTKIPLLKCRRNVILLLLKKMKQNTLFINCFSKKCSKPGLPKFSLLDFSIYISLSNSLSKIIFLTNALIVPIFLFFLIKLVPFGSSNIVIHVSSNDHFCPVLFSWAAIIVNDYLQMQIFICGLFPELIELSPWMIPFFCQTSLQILGLSYQFVYL